MHILYEQLKRLMKLKKLGVLDEAVIKASNWNVSHRFSSSESDRRANLAVFATHNNPRKVGEFNILSPRRKTWGYTAKMASHLRSSLGTTYRLLTNRKPTIGSLCCIPSLPKYTLSLSQRYSLVEDTKYAS